jgi:hypothetical protein
MRVIVSWDDGRHRGPLACTIDGRRRGPLARTTVKSGTRDACLDTLTPFLVVGVAHACGVAVHEGLLGAVVWILAVIVVF